MKILVIDDEPKIRRGLERLIQHIEPEAVVYTAEDGLAGLELLKSIKVDLIFVDIKMPNMNGLQFIGEAKEIDSQIQFVIVSGYGEFEYAQQAIEYNALGYILKPVMPAKVVEVLERAKHLKVQKSQSKESIEELKMKYLDELIHTPQLSAERLAVALRKIEIKSFYWLVGAKSFLGLDAVKKEVYEIIKNKCVQECQFLITGFENKYIFVVTCEDMKFCQCNKWLSKLLSKSEVISQLEYSEVLEDKEQLQLQLGMILERFEQENIKNNNTYIIERVKTYIHKNYKEKITLQDIAKSVYLHPAYVSDLFKKTTGQNISDYIQNIRIKQAKKLIKDTPQYKIYKIAEQVGFVNEKYFSKVFKEIEGITPNEYRKKT